MDDAVVLAVIRGSVSPRPAADSADLVLAADDMDFAGWRLSPALPARATEAPPVRRAAAPELEEEPGLGEPHRGSHRWWLAGLAGAFSTMLFSVLLVSLASRGGSENENFSLIKPLPAGQPAPALEAPAPAAAPELTGVPAGK